MHPKLIYESDRLFSVFGYSMSHGLLPLRSGKSNETTATRVDILFQDVRAMETRAEFKGIRIEEVDDPQFLDGQRSNPGEMIEPGNKIYGLVSAGWRGFIVGGIVQFKEDDGELFGHPTSCSGIFSFASIAFRIWSVCAILTLRIVSNGWQNSL